MAYVFNTPPPRRQYPSAFTTASAAPVAGGSSTYADLPQELQTPVRNYGTNYVFSALEQRQPPSSISLGSAPVSGTQVVPTRPAGPAVDIQAPIARAAQTISETMDNEKRFPQLDDIVSQGQSAEYEMTTTLASEPYSRINNHTIPDVIFEQYNRATSHTKMGLFADIRQAWLTVDNRLYLWDYQTQSGFQGYEEQSHTITCVRILKPKPGVFVQGVNYILAIATTNEVLLLGVEAKENARGVMDVLLYDTRMSVPTKGTSVNIIEGSGDTGRVFFAGEADNDVYEFLYQAEERWFQGRCSKICHTSKGVSTFAPRLPYWNSQRDTEYVKQMVIDDSRKLLYTLSSKSTIRAFSVRPDGGLSLTITHTFSHILANIRVMVGPMPLLGPDTPIISISPVPALQARRTHLIAITKSGCRLFMSAVASEYGYGGTDAAPTSMQVIHIRYPPQGQVNNNVRKASVFSPGYFFCFLEKGPQYDELFLAAPDSGKIQQLADSGSSRLQLVEQGSILPLDSRVEAVEVVAGAFNAAKTSSHGFGNELATQCDLPSTEIAVLTNSGVHIVRRRRLVEVFDAILRHGSSSSPLGVEGDVRTFFESYGRAEGCASALAVACGAGYDSGNSPTTTSKITDVEVFELARKYFIEFGGKPRAENVYDASALPSLDSIKVSGRAEGLALYVTRIVRSIWKAWIINEVRTPAGGLDYVPTVPVPKLRNIQEQLIKLATFLQNNKSFIVGLSGAESLMVAGSKIEEVANQAEHRALHAMLTLIEGMIEGISFVLFLFDDKLADIILSLPGSQRDTIGKMNYGELFSSPAGQALAKELVTAIVNRNIAAGMNVDTIADALRKRCGSFCSADDVVVFKAVEHVRKAKDERDPDTKNRLLREALRLFEETAGSLTMDNLADTVSEFRSLKYYPGAVQLALSVAREVDRGNLALQFLTEPPTVQGTAADLYLKRVDCYQLIFKVLEDLDRGYGQSPDMIDGVPSHATRLRNETWNLIYSSDDELFHYQLYDWLFSRGETFAERLLEVDSPHVLGYLQHRGAESIDHCELLWAYHARRENFYEAAQVLHELAQSEFQLNLEKRLEFFSRARSLCSSYGALGTRQRMSELSQTIQEELDVAVIQDDILKRIREDKRISGEKKTNLEKHLDSKLINLSELFNKYADAYSYYDICLCIFLAADYRGQAEIRKCWGSLITEVHQTAVSDSDGGPPFKLVADTIRRLGHRFVMSEYIFPPTDLIPLLENYAYEQQKDLGPPGWVVDTFLEAGVTEETILRVLEEMFWRDEVPFAGTTRRRLLTDAVYVAQKWWTKVVRRGGGQGFDAKVVGGALRSMVSSLPRGRDTDNVDVLLADVARRSAA